MRGYIDKADFFSTFQELDMEPYNRFPTADVVPVVLCKDCRNSEHFYRDRCLCFLWNENGIDVLKNGYCNYGVQKNNWYEKIAKKMGYQGCKNCKHQIDVLRSCEWLESGGDGQLHLICPKWEKREKVSK